MTGDTTNYQKRAVDHIIFPAVSPSQVAELGPLVFTRGEGIYLWDTEGKRYMDSMSSGVYAVLIGYGREEMAQTMYDQAGRCTTSAPTASSHHHPSALLKSSQGAAGRDALCLFHPGWQRSGRVGFKLAKQWAYQKDINANTR